VRRSRPGRAIVALRENERAAQAYAVSPVPVKLMAFTISGAVAGIAGGLFVHLSQSFDLASYGPGQSLSVFTAGVVGGLGSLFGGVLGAIYLRGTDWFITEPAWQFLSSAVGVLLVLLILPGGLSSLVIKLRDRLVGFILARRPRQDEQHLHASVAEFDLAEIDMSAHGVSANGVGDPDVEAPATETDDADNVIVERSQP